MALAALITARLPAALIAIGPAHARFAAPVRAAFAAVARAWATRRDERTLASLPDHVLKDIGLGRDRFSGAVRRITL
jgi:uncharacterized protein YjiS (DUF1127 family)